MIDCFLSAARRVFVDEYRRDALARPSFSRRARVNGDELRQLIAARVSEVHLRCRIDAGPRGLNGGRVRGLDGAIDD